MDLGLLITDDNGEEEKGSQRHITQNMQVLVKGLKTHVFSFEDDKSVGDLKVEKQEKKKKKTGRAKRRMQYNRRFVNVVQTFGRRRGPNTNS
ncbi:unnamed protein product [Darwinula stevensoni]|uniref:40S ribosomal protein S30 n=1 Tax=Darwinula stevensoni TaxID=69355 RepID=A0A7R8X6K6_9CRUS|nr:unnamed protein product [Darwinula stevensoni]CAG0887715.1 unnamed protein product [Darwinula stevensoni]